MMSLLVFGLIVTVFILFIIYAVAGSIVVLLSGGFGLIRLCCFLSEKHYKDEKES